MLTIEDEIVERFVVLVREQDVILDRSAHDPVRPVNKGAEK